MKVRPEWVRCVEDNNGRSWCGRRIGPSDLSFVGVDHDAMNGRNGGRLVACQECVTAIYEGLRNGQSDD